MKKIFVALLLLVIPTLVFAESLPKKDWVIALSNSYYGNTWRKQMVQTFTAAAEEAKAQGYIKDYVIVNGDGTQNQQIAQMNSLILKGVDAICINAASPTALNGVIKKAHERKIKIIAFDSIVTSPYAYKMDFDFVKLGADSVEYMNERLGGKGNLVIVRGVSGSAPDQEMYQGHVETLKKYPGFNVVATINGEASTTTTQNAMANVLPSLPKVDGVLIQGGGDAFGVVQAFLAAGREVPIVIGDGSSEFVQWWIAEKKNRDYETFSINSAPSIGGAAFWVAVNLLDGVKVPEKMKMALTIITNDDVENYADLKPGSIAAPVYSNEFVQQNVIGR